MLKTEITPMTILFSEGENEDIRTFKNVNNQVVATMKVKKKFIELRGQLDLMWLVEHVMLSEGKPVKFFIDDFGEEFEGVDFSVYNSVALKINEHYKDTEYEVFGISVKGSKLPIMAVVLFDALFIYDKVDFEVDENIFEYVVKRLGAKID